MYSHILAFDLETTGLDAYHDQIISISARLLNLDLTVEKTITIFAFPECAVSPQAAAVNGYTRELWAQRGAVTQEELFNRIYEFVKDYKGLMPLGHNISFDISFLNILWDKFGKTKEFNTMIGRHKIDTVTCSVVFDFVLFGKLSSSYRLEEITKRFGISLENAHDASCDIDAAINLFKYVCTSLGTSAHTKTADHVPAPVPSTHGQFLVSKNGTWFINAGKHKNEVCADVVKRRPDYGRWILAKIADLTAEQRLFIEQILEQP